MSKKNRSQRIRSYVYLIAGCIALVWWLFLLMDIAVGLLLLFLGFTAINQWLMKQ